MLLRTLSLALLLATPCGAQGVVHDAMIWGAAFGDHRIASKTSLYWDYHGRRAESGSVWQIKIGAVGITRDLSKQWRATVALGGSSSHRYGEFPARTNVAEVRPWVQLTGTRKVAAVTWSDRTRAELRLLHAVGELAPDDADWQPSIVRLRRQDRFQHALTTDGRWYAAATQEFLVNVHPARVHVAMLEQSRTQVVVGHQLSRHNRIETGYGLQRINRRGGFEMNHTLLVNFRTSVPLR